MDDINFRSLLVVIVSNRAGRTLICDAGSNNPMCVFQIGKSSYCDFSRTASESVCPLGGITNVQWG